MLTCPRIGQSVQVWYTGRIAAAMPHHGAVGVVVARKTKGRPRNHLVLVGAVAVVVPCGNLRRGGGG